jgi:hypothetical protein
MDLDHQLESEGKDKALNRSRNGLVQGAYRYNDLLVVVLQHRALLKWMLSFPLRPPGRWWIS